MTVLIYLTIRTLLLWMLNQQKMAIIIITPSDPNQQCNTSSKPRPSHIEIMDVT